MLDQDFQFFTQLSVFEKADAPAGQKRRIAGIVSTETKDKQKEVVLQRGLDFGYFEKNGWFNDNHSKSQTDILGYPDGPVRKFRKGDVLPDGQVAKSNGSWAEGYLLETKKAQDVWEIAQALQKSGSDRRLGFSVEGKVLERRGAHGEIVAKAEVRNIAITHVPVGDDTRLEALAKSLDHVEKGMTATGGTMPPTGNPSEGGPTTGEGAGRILIPQHLEQEGARRILDDEEEDEAKKPIRKSLAVAMIGNRMKCDVVTAERIYGAIKALSQRS